MKISKPSNEKIRELFCEYNSSESSRDKVIKMVEIRDFFHEYYMEKINIILAIAGEMQKHFKEG